MKNLGLIGSQSVMPDCKKMYLNFDPKKITEVKDLNPDCFRKNS